MSQLTLIQMRAQQVLFFDNKTQNTYYINNIISEHRTNHIRVIYMQQVRGGHKQQFTDYFFFKLLESGSIKQL